MSTALEFVSLVGGGHVRLDAYHLFIDLDLRGCLLQRNGDSLRVGAKIPGADAPELTPAERASIAELKPHLLALVDYCEHGPRESVTDATRTQTDATTPVFGANVKNRRKTKR